MVRKENWKEVKIYYQENGSECIELYNLCQELGIEDLFDTINNNSERINIEDTIYYFEAIQSGDTLYVIYIDVEYNEGHRAQIETLLKHFFGKDFPDHFTKRYSHWDEFKHNCIAYRAGEGDTYTIWKYNDRR